MTLRFLNNFYPDQVINLDDLIFCFNSESVAGEEAYYYYDIAELILNNGDKGIRFMLDTLDKSNKIFQNRAIIFSITSSKGQKILPKVIGEKRLLELLIKLLNSHEPLIIAEAIDGLRHMEKKDTLDTVLALADHPSPYVQGSVLRFVSAFYPDLAFPMLIKALESSHYIVRDNAADQLGELELEESKISEALAHLRPLLVDPHPFVRQAVQTAIAFLEDQ